ncbi:hypothetical protein ACFW04_007179 [Cataglyphis niger]
MVYVAWSMVHSVTQLSRNSVCVNPDSRRRRVSMKMKRMKSDVISATIESYLKRRHYQANDYCKGDQLFCQSSDQMTLNATAECGTSQDNSIVFSAITIDVTAADQAYQRLKKWMNIILNEKIKVELQGLLFPIFCHLYLEMLHAGNRQAAIQFLKAHQNEFVSDTEKDFLEELSRVFSVQDIELRSLVNAFRTRKYKVDLSESAHICLRQYLTRYGHIILMQHIVPFDSDNLDFGTAHDCSFYLITLDNLVDPQNRYPNVEDLLFARYPIDLYILNKLYIYIKYYKLDLAILHYIYLIIYICVCVNTSFSVSLSPILPSARTKWPSGYFEFRGHESSATIILCLLNISACRVSILILGIFLSAGTNRCLITFSSSEASSASSAFSSSCRTISLGANH